MKRSFLLISVLALALSGCAKSGTGNDGSSGIQGVVQAGPQCPVERADSPCPDRPFPSTVRATSTGGATKNVTTDDQGRFRLALAPGTYIVSVVVESGPPPSAQPRSVVVTAGSFTKVTLEVDTGIR